MSHRVKHRKFGRRRKVGSRKRRMAAAQRHGHKWHSYKTGKNPSKRRH